MASTSVLKLKVDDQEYNASLKTAQQGMQHLEKALQDAGKSFRNVDRSVVDYVRSIGQMETKSKSARGRIGEMSSAFVELSQMEKRLTDQERQSPVGQALTRSIEQLRQRTIDAKRELEDLNRQISTTQTPDAGGGGGGFLSGIGGKMGGALQVFAGNMLTKAAGAVANLGSEMYGIVQQGIELAKAGEGIRIAFERLGRGDILEGLREATHGTVSDIELMKAAVKFNDFKLPLEELGTMLAFAQQKAKDTGQSVDFLVESIVNGLGRQSLMILDNLGLSANEVKEKMKETGDMTTAVGAIIREQMAKAGDYVETAADRAAQATVSMQNKMEELGRLFAPLQESSNQLWTSMKIAILDVVSGPLARLLNGLTEAGRLRNTLNDMNATGSDGQTHTGRVLGALRHYSGDKQGLYNRQVARYNELENQEWQRYNQLQARQTRLRQQYGSMAGGGLDKEMEAARNRALAWQVIRSDYQKGAQSILNPSSGSNNRPSAVDDEKKKTKNTKATVEKTEMQINSEQIQKLTQEYIAASAERRQAIQQEIKVLQDRNKEIQNLMDEAQGKTSPTQKLTQQNIADINKSKSGSILGDDFMKPGTVDYKAPIEAMNIVLKEFIALRDKATTPEEWQRLNKAINGVQKGMDDFTGKGGNNGGRKDTRAVAKEIQDIADKTGKIGGSLSSIAGGIEQMGIEIPDEINKGLSLLQGVTSILTGISTLLLAISATEKVQTVTDLIPIFANGGVIHAASGFRVPGNTYSMDQVPAMLNSGEVVLNRAQAGNIASQLNDGNTRGGYQPSHISGEQIYLAMNRYLMRTGRGEIVTWK